MTTSSQTEINPETNALLMRGHGLNPTTAMPSCGCGDSCGDASLISLTGLMVAGGLSRA